MMVFKRKQIVVLALVLMIVVAGYLQYSYKKSSISASGKENGKLGEAVYVGSNGMTDEKQDATNKDKSDKATTASKQAVEFFTQAKMDKESSRSKDLETLKAMTTDSNANKETKDKAYQQMMNIVDISQKEMRIETLIKEKGFEDVVVLFGDDGSLDVVVKSPSLTTAHAAQIADIASRQAKIDIDKVHIKNMY